MTKYYKAFKRDLTCRDMQYVEGGVYEMPEQPILCQKGFHFCKDLVLTLEYYPVNNDICENLYAEVEPYGDVVWDEPTKHKGCTNKLRILRVIPDHEVKALVDPRNNSGDSNSGHSNSGHSNSGDSNSGDSNSGHRNSGHRNSGDRNSGDSNSGHRNSGHSNSGHSNSGHSNSGHRNSGHWNSVDRETGMFNSKPSATIRVFNKPCKVSVWEKANKPDFLYFEVDKTIGYKGSFQASYDKASDADKAKVLKLPNFDADVFFEISGIDLRKPAKKKTKKKSKAQIAA